MPLTIKSEHYMYNLLASSTVSQALFQEDQLIEFSSVSINVPD
jgi:hypothetical protein